MRVLGIDPGITGGLALLIDNGRAEKMVVDSTHHMPAIPRPTRTPAKTKKKMIDGRALSCLFEEMQPNFVFVESVRALPPKRYYDPRERKMIVEQGMGATSAFNFGESFGVIKGVLYALGLEFETLEPQSWKRAHGLIGTEKDKSRELARSLFPYVSLDRKKDLPIAEAILIARCGVFVRRSDAASSASSVSA
jgi:crossover junction endodeoxyribonuclease RuvC